MTKQKQAKLESKIEALMARQLEIQQLCQRVFEAHDDKSDIEPALRALADYLRLGQTPDHTNH